MTWLTVSLALALALALTSPAQASPCPSGWVDATYVDLGCLKFHDRGNNFEEAAIYCQNYQARLLEVETAEQLDFVRTELDVLTSDGNQGSWTLLGPNWTSSPVT